MNKNNIELEVQDEYNGSVANRFDLSLLVPYNEFAGYFYTQTNL